MWILFPFNQLSGILQILRHNHLQNQFNANILLTNTRTLPVEIFFSYRCLEQTNHF
ncbi:hypothetical protein GJA_4159 [Janthinobacterium agaricidamnosum NBRC 102515 = DSM 9628]|uniref:Uncharacterized protein n=1 Tax=Janthinobacterium agaricidamnosum NBRC 102515 = DSM 9628 TaxID=1349767 RepID=W0V7F6_9BURK|nr:hypothetical protein GJA_4159 [Janthinobacterium agaricidamnosum NBRC 102515 = DSM 9628]